MSKVYALLLTLCLLANTIPAEAQIELATDGNVSVGSDPVNVDRKLNVWYGKLSSNTSVIYARYIGVGNYNANAVFARATTTAAYGYGGTFHGGQEVFKGMQT